jgi:hypothetical protein
MPCRSGLEEDLSPQEQIYADIASKHLSSYYEEHRLNNKLLNLEENKATIASIEDVAFNSFMTVWLCKAMNMLDSQGVLHFMTADALWWYDEHQYRDANGDKSSLTQEEIAKKLVTIINNHKVE